MEWQIQLLILLAGLLGLMATGMTVVFSFLTVNAFAMFCWWGGAAGLEMLILSIQKSITHFRLLPIPLFILLGTLMFETGMGENMIDALDKWLGRLPGRLGLLAVFAGALFGSLSGSSMSSVAMLGSLLTPEMEKRGYKKPMSLGPILGSGGLSVMIPPSNLGVLLGAIGGISIGSILIAIIIPGLLMTLFYASYIILVCVLKPQLAPRYEIVSYSLREKLLYAVKDLLPLGVIIFLVTGVIFFGIASPTEAAATGTMGCIVLALLKGKFSWKIFIKSLYRTVNISVMVLFIICTSEAYSQNLAYSGITRELAQFVINLEVPSMIVIIGMVVVLIGLGMIMAVPPIMMITLPIFLPVVSALGYNEVWFAVVFLLCMEMSQTSPPFGLTLFVMKGVSPSGTTLEDCWKAAIPFLGCDLVVLILLLVFPIIAIWLPGLM